MCTKFVFIVNGSTREVSFFIHNKCFVSTLIQILTLILIESNNWLSLNLIFNRILKSKQSLSQSTYLWRNLLRNQYWSLFIIELMKFLRFILELFDLNLNHSGLQVGSSFNWVCRLWLKFNWKLVLIYNCWIMIWENLRMCISSMLV